MPMVIPESNYWRVPSLYSPDMKANGPRRRQKWRADIFSSIIRNSKRLIKWPCNLQTFIMQNSSKDAARLKLAKWFDKVSKLAGSAFQTAIDTFTNHYDTILNFFVNRQTNATAESFNAKVKDFRSQFRGESDIPFFLFRLSLLCA